MTLHELPRQAASILSPEYQEDLFDYFLHAMDDNGGFLRTRWCRREKELPDHKVPDNIRKLLLTLREPFDLRASNDYYAFEGEPFEKETLTKLKLQLFYYDVSDDAALESEIEWSRELRYDIPI